MDCPTHVLTLHPWWLPAFDAPLNKDVENRCWRLPEQFRGRPIAFHAGMRTPTISDLADMAWAFGRAGFPACVESGAGFTARLRWSVGGEDRYIYDEHLVRGAIVGVAVMSDLSRYDYSSRWAHFTSYPWPIARWVRLPKPIPCRGGQGLRRIPEAVRREIASALAGCS